MSKYLKIAFTLLAISASLVTVFGDLGKHMKASKTSLKLSDTLNIADLHIHLNDGNIKEAIIENSWGVQMLKIRGQELTIPKNAIDKAGIHRLTLINDENIIVETAEFYVRSATANPVLETYLSYPILKAGTGQKSQITSLPTDIYDNLLDRPDIVQIYFQTANTLPVVETYNDFNLAYFLIASSTVVNEVPVSVHTQKSYSNTNNLQIEPSNPSTAVLTYSRTTPYADGQQTVNIVARNILDKYGNTVVDGTLLNFRVIEKGKKSDIKAVVINHEAKAQFIAPFEPSTITVALTQDQKIISNVLSLPFEKLKVDFNISVANNIVKIDHIHTSALQNLEDGTKVQLYIQGNTSQYLLEGQVENNVIEFNYKDYVIPPGYYQYSLSVLGQKYTGQIKL